MKDIKIITILLLTLLASSFLQAKTHLVHTDGRCIEFFEGKMNAIKGDVILHIWETKAICDNPGTGDYKNKPVSVKINLPGVDLSVKADNSKSLKDNILTALFDALVKVEGYKSTDGWKLTEL